MKYSTGIYGILLKNKFTSENWPNSGCPRNSLIHGLFGCVSVYSLNFVCTCWT